MVWQRILSGLSRSKQRSAGKRKQRRLQMERMERRELLASDIGVISGTAFVDQGNDGSPTGDPPVLVDNAGNLVAPGTAGAQGIQIQLFTDTNNDDTFDVNDQLIGTDISTLTGNYRFDGLSPGVYFVQQASVPGLRVPEAQRVEVTNDGGIQTALIDDYSTTTQSVTATANSTQTDSAAASEAIGGARDIVVTNTAGAGQLTLFIDSAAASQSLSVGSLGGGTGTALVQYDGSDGATTLDAAGLGGVSLGGGAPGVAVDPDAGLIVQAFAQNAGDSLLVTVYSSGGSSTATIPIDADTNFVESFVRFSTFTTATGSGADFNNVGAIEASVGLSANNDVEVSIVEAIRPDVVVQNLANIQLLALGGEVFRDNSQVGQNDGIRQGTEAGLTGITVQLYELAGPNDVVDLVNDTPITSTTTGANGAYNFPGLDPGNYAVVVPDSQFGTGAGLFGFANSTGNDPATDPDDNIDSDDDGTKAATTNDVVSGTITIESNQEPINDDDTDPNTNTTVDFGFFPQIDLEITKTLNAAGSNVAAGGNAVFDIVVENKGPLAATNVVVEDIFPAGLTFTGTSNTSGTFTTNVNGTTVTIDIGTLAADATATFQFSSTIAANQTTDLTNTATVSGTEVEVVATNNSDDELLDLIASDVRIEKIDLTDPVNAGTQFTYEITVTNDGPDAAAGVVVVDPLPAGVSFVSGNVDGAANLVSFDSGTREVTATVGSLANAGVSTITIVVDVDPDVDDANPLLNTATVTVNPNTDPNPDNNNTDEQTDLNRLVDVTIDKTVSGTAIAGGTVTYTVEVSNAGPSQARGVTVVDTLNADLTLVNGSFNANTSGITLAQSGQDLTFTVGTLDPNETHTFTFDVLIDTDAFGTIPNQATIATTDPQGANTNPDTDNADIVVGRQVDLILTKTVDRATAVPGQDQLIYTFVVSHDTDSISDAVDVQVTDVLPTGLIGAVISAPGATSDDFSNGTVTVDYATLPIGETRTFTVTVDIDEAATGDASGNVVNPASVTSTGSDLDTTNNSDTATTELTPDFDIVVGKTVGNAAPAVNGTVTYTVTVQNEGPSTATGVVLSDVVPTGLTFVSGTMGGQQGTNSGGTVSFPAITLASGATQTATLNFTVNASASGTITNTASVPNLSSAGENDVTNNSGSVDITVTPVVDLTVSKTVSTANAQAGGSLTYTMTVNNSGPSTAANVVATDTLPAGVTFVSGTDASGNVFTGNQTGVTVNGQVITVNGGSVASNGSFTFTVTGSVDAGATGRLTNNVAVVTDTNESNTQNNSASAFTDVDPVTSSIAGRVYIDLNNNGVQDTGENGISGVQVTLSGTDTLGNAVNRSATTDASGDYVFAQLAAGTYNVVETQPSGFRDGQETAGSGATSSNTGADSFNQLVLAPGTAATAFNFGELTEGLSKRRFLASTPTN